MRNHSFDLMATHILTFLTCLAIAGRSFEANSLATVLLTHAKFTSLDALTYLLIGGGASPTTASTGVETMMPQVTHAVLLTGTLHRPDGAVFRRTTPSLPSRALTMVNPSLTAEQVELCHGSAGRSQLTATRPLMTLMDTTAALILGLGGLK